MGLLAISAGPIPGLQVLGGRLLFPLLFEPLFPKEENPLKFLFIDKVCADEFEDFALEYDELFGDNFE
jgi:hypothetical protein